MKRRLPELRDLLRMLSALVTGGNRGIGLGLVRELLKEPTVGIVIATVRKLEAAKELRSIDSPKLHVVICDITDEQSIAEAVVKVTAIVDGNGLDILINNAGINIGRKLDGEDLTKAVAMEMMEVNTVGPLLVTNKFHGLLKTAAALNGSSQIANISSGYGSLELAMGFDSSAAIYSISKAALNMLTRKLAMEWKTDKIRATAFTPGWVRTEMGSQAADLSVEESTSPLTKLIISLTEENNGEFYSYLGEKRPW